MPDFVDSLLLKVISGVSTIDSLLHHKNLSLQNPFALSKGPKVFSDILKLRLNVMNTDSNSKPVGFLGEILHSLEAYNLLPYPQLWQRVSISPSYNRLLTAEFSSACFLTASQEKPVVKVTSDSFTIS